MLANDSSFRFVPPAYSSPNELKKAGVIQGLHAERMASATVLFTANWVLANHKIELQIEQRKVILLNTTVGGTRVRIGFVDVPLCYRHLSTPPHATSAIIHVDRGISAHRCFFTNAAGFMTGIPWNSASFKRCLSPLTMQSAFPATANRSLRPPMPSSDPMDVGKQPESCTGGDASAVLSIQNGRQKVAIHCSHFFSPTMARRSISE